MLENLQDTFQQFRAKLDELFQMDRAELDFGMYRIMNIKRGEISRYLGEDLYPQVEEILADAASDDARTVQEELATLEANLRDAGVEPESSPKVKVLRTRLAATTSPEELRHRTFSHLLTFFSRYYDKGDFISKRRYKDGTYMIPYNGEEVKLVWANMDQYYVKTTEYLRDYRFFLNAEKTFRMTFKLVEGDTERDNINSLVSSLRYAQPTGSSTRKSPSPERSKYSTTSAGTPTVWPSPTTGFSPSKTVAFASGGKTTETRSITRR